MAEGVKQLPARIDIREEFLIDRQGKQYVLYAGLLDVAHRKGLKGIDTELIQVPTEENGRVAICKARVEMMDDSSFSGIGDASPENVGRNIAPHIIRMAETRAKARALRDAVNAGAALLEDEPGEPEAEPVLATPHSYSLMHVLIASDIQKVLYRMDEEFRREKGLTDAAVFAQAEKGEEWAAEVLRKIQGYAREAGVLPSEAEKEETEDQSGVMPDDLITLVKVLDAAYGGESDTMSGSEWYEEDILGHPLSEIAPTRAKQLIEELSEKGAQA